jgi:hypothetical protein
MNEPVAIVKKITIGGIDNFPIEQFVRLKEGTLLYTHPVKELTDAEIDQVIEEITGCGGKWNIVDLIKASLKKASEK